MYAPFGEGVGDSIGVDVEVDVTATVDVIVAVGVTIDVTVTVEHCGATESVSSNGMLELTVLTIVDSLDSCCVVLTSDVIVGDGGIVTVAGICEIEMTMYRVNHS